MIPEDDFNPDTHPPITRTRCLALGWHDNDPMPATCQREPNHDGEHIANVFGGNVRVAGPLVTWDTNETMEDLLGHLSLKHPRTETMEVCS